MLSTLEAVHFAKPVIGIPSFFDQNFNMKNTQIKGYGISVPYEQLTVDKLRDAIRTIFTDSRSDLFLSPNVHHNQCTIFFLYLICSYVKNVNYASFCYHNQIETPLNTAIYWVKHVVKHNGAHYLRSRGTQMPFYVYYNLDCMAFLLAVSILSCLISLKLCKVAFKLVFKKKPTPKLKSS